MPKSSFMEGRFASLLEAKVADGVTGAVPRFTRRDVHVPRIRGKALAVIGARRAGKTTFLWQCLADRLAAGAPRESLLFVSFEDERLAGLEGSGLAHLVEAFFRRHPEWRDRRRVAFFLDEIQNVPGWEAFVRRLLDSEQIDLHVSGSSARLLSREVATSMRGRALEVLVHPFSFREALRHDGAEPTGPWVEMSKAARSDLAKRLGAYLERGGFPETLGADARDRAALLRGYVDVALLRDVIERYRLSNPLVARALLRHLLANPAGTFSVEKFHRVLKSQGFAVGKDTVHACLGHLEDAFFVRTVSLHTASERRRMVNPRKVYPVDPGLIPLYEAVGRANVGQAVETSVFVELERRGAQVDYVLTKSGREVDFHARMPEGPPLLIQAAADVSSADTFERETRSLAEAAAEDPRATPLLVTLDDVPFTHALPAGIRWQPLASFLLDGPATR